MPVMRMLLRDQVREEVLDRLLRGDYPVGTRINEVSLAAEIGVSRTPLREALTSLAREGILQARPGRGFWLTPLTVRDIEDAYPIIAQLEVLALRLSGRDVLTAKAEQLIKLADKMASCDGGGAAHDADDEWHAVLLDACPNERLLGLIRDTKRTVHRYENVYLGDKAAVRESADQHKRIARALAVGDLSKAAEELESNWETSMHRMIERLSGPSHAH